MRVGIDTGGTFTDFVFFDGKNLFTHKVSSTPSDPSEAIMSGLIDIIGNRLSNFDVVHGTTVATNSLLERKGAVIALVTTDGFQDVIEIGRQNRDSLYDVFWQAHQPLVEKELRFGITERTTYQGKVLSRVSKDQLEELFSKLKRLNVEGVAISFLHSYANPTNEKIVAEHLNPLGVPISASSQILPEFREYERTSTVVANSYLLPKVKLYMDSLSSEISSISDSSCDLSVMQSNGGIISPEKAGDEPVRILLSGPAGGVVGSFNIAASMGYERIITYDMGGTSTDVSLCNGGIDFTTETEIDGIPISVPMIDVTTIGAGGGSIAHCDVGGALKLGPKSAGADPGPVCYGKGDELTVTDAHVALGRIDTEWFLGGRMKISKQRSEIALEKLAREMKLPLNKGGLGQVLLDLAEGVIRVANANMERALRSVSIERGYDPRDFAMVSFGGAGGLHACELARNIETKKVVFPRSPGVLSALGMLMADSFKDYSVTVFLAGALATAEALEGRFIDLERKALADFQSGVRTSSYHEQISFKRFLDARYKRQAHELTIPYTKNFIGVFHRAHKKAFGYMKTGDGVEVVTIRVRAVAKKRKIKLPKLTNEKIDIYPQKKKIIFEGRQISVATYKREEFYCGFAFTGPSLILENTSTIFVPPDYKCAVDDWGNIEASAY